DLTRQDSRCPFCSCRLPMKIKHHIDYWTQECPSGHFKRINYENRPGPIDAPFVDHFDEQNCRSKWRTVKAWENQLGTLVCTRCFPPFDPEIVGLWVEIVQLDSSGLIN